MQQLQVPISRNIRFIFLASFECKVWVSGSKCCPGICFSSWESAAAPDPACEPQAVGPTDAQSQETRAGALGGGIFVWCKDPGHLIPAELCYLKVDLGIKFCVQVFQSIFNNKKSFFFFTFPRSVFPEAEEI